MKAALDVHYESSRSIAACVIFNNWIDSEPTGLVRAVVPSASQYRAGMFYERELPCLISVLKQTDIVFDSIIIDGYVHLKADMGKGLGAYLFESIPYSPAVIGVAKNPFKLADNFVTILRGRSRKPLFISAIGCSIEHAVQSILGMYGPYRIPTLLKLTDHLSRAT
jgi:deoxyribonuclease V